jgi:transcriptional regulator with XRE-family HTH domain
MRNLPCYGRHETARESDVNKRSETPSEVLARQIRVWRDRRKLSAQAVSDRIAEHGGKLSRVAISRIETGDRDVSLNEFLMLAHALSVPPALLLVDLKSGEHVAVMPDIAMHPWLVWQWASGQTPPLVVNDRGGAILTRVEEFAQSQTAVGLYREEEDAANSVHHQFSNLRNAEYVGETRALEKARLRYIEALKQLAKVHDQMVENDMEPPAKPAGWIKRIRENGLSKYPDRLAIWRPQGPVDKEQLDAVLEHLRGRPDLQEIYVDAWEAGEKILLPEGFADDER